MMGVLGQQNHPAWTQLMDKNAHCSARNYFYVDTRESIIFVTHRVCVAEKRK